MFDLFIEYFTLQADKYFECEMDIDDDGNEEPVSNINTDFADNEFDNFCCLLNIDESDPCYPELKQKFDANREKLVEDYNDEAIAEALRGGNDYEPQF